MKSAVKERHKENLMKAIILCNTLIYAPVEIQFAIYSNVWLLNML